MTSHVWYLYVSTEVDGRDMALRVEEAGFFSEALDFSHDQVRRWGAAGMMGSDCRHGWVVRMDKSVDPVPYALDAADASQRFAMLGVSQPEITSGVKCGP